MLISLCGIFLAFLCDAGKDFSHFLTGSAPGPVWKKTTLSLTSPILITAPSVPKMVRVPSEILAFLAPSLADRDDPVEDYYTQQRLVQTGASQAEIDASAAEIRTAYAAWRRPKAVELYDLHEDPHEFHDLSQSAQHMSIRQRLETTLADWCQQSGGPLWQRDKLERLVAEDQKTQSLGRRPQEAGFPLVIR